MSVAASRLVCLHTQYVKKERLGCTAAPVPSKPLLPLFPPLFLFAALLLQLWFRLSFIERGYELEELRRSALQNDSLLRQKKLEFAFLSRPASIIEDARERLQMTETEPQRLRKISFE